MLLLLLLFGTTSSILLVIRLFRLHAEAGKYTGCASDCETVWIIVELKFYPTRLAHARII
jgi:hypothetical protein